MQGALPSNAVFVVAFEMGRRVAVGVQCEMLVIEAGVRVVEVGMVLPVVFVGGVVLVGTLIFVGDVVVEQPVCDQAFLLALDDFAVRRPNPRRPLP